MKPSLAALLLVLALGTSSGATHASSTRSSALAASPKHRIGVRVRNGSGELFDRRTEKTFVVRGTNYLRLSAGPGPRFDLLFDPAGFSKPTVQHDFKAMRALGFNTVRVFLDLAREDRIGSSVVLNPAYVDRVAAVLRIAKATKLYLLPTVNQWDGAMSYRASIPRTRFAGSFNGLYLTSEGIKAGSRFFTDLIGGLKKRKAPLDAVLAWELRNEQFFEWNLPPFSLSSGTVKIANGRTYDLSDPAAKERMAIDGLRTYIARVRSAIRKADPGVPVTMGFFNPQPADDPRYVRTAPLLEDSALDLFDFHYYPGGSTPLSEAVAGFGMAKYKAKPVILGEFGAFRFAYPSAEEGAAALVDLQVESCGQGFDGWLHWLWADSDPELWTGPDGGGAINRALSPKQRRDPCAYGGATVHELARGRPANASASLPGSPPALAFDGDAQNGWISGADAPQWIEIDLGAPSAITKIALSVSQDPAGQTIHRVWGHAEGGPGQLLHEFSGFTKEPSWLEFSPGTPWKGIRYLRVETVASPSWVAWHEIRVLGSQPG